LPGVVTIQLNYFFQPVNAVAKHVLRCVNRK
jgi:hypothetical protein